jgi:hypothetical protein
MLKALVLLYLALAIVLVSKSSPAQDITTINWGDKGAPFRTIYIDGRPVERFEDSKVRIDVFPAFTDGSHSYSALIGVVNMGSTELDVDPSRFFACGDDAQATVFPWVNGDAKIAKQEKSANRRAALAAGLAGFGAGMQQETATVASSDGSTSTVTYHDPSATQRVQDDAQQGKKARGDRFATLSSQVMRHNTVEPGHFALGRVYFQSPKDESKKAAIACIVVRLSTADYRFLWRGNQPEPLSR